MRRTLSTLCVLATLGAGWSAGAAAAPRTISVVLVAPDGAKSAPMEATDMAVTLNRSTDPAASDLSSQATMSMDVTTLSNRGLLDWLKQNGTGAVITVESRGAPTMTYELHEISSRTVSANHSSSSDGQLSLSLTAGTMTVNGVSVK